MLQAGARTLSRTCARSSSLVLQAQGVHVSAQGSDVCAFVRRMVRVRAYARACVRPRTLTCLFCNAARWREILQGTCAPTHMLVTCIHACACVLGKVVCSDPRCGHRLSIRLSKMLEHSSEEGTPRVCRKVVRTRALCATHTTAFEPRLMLARCTHVLSCACVVPPPLGVVCKCVRALCVRRALLL